METGWYWATHRISATENSKMREIVFVNHYGIELSSYIVYRAGMSHGCPIGDFCDFSEPITESGAK
jgi:hypothetical protein